GLSRGGSRRSTKPVGPDSKGGNCHENLSVHKAHGYRRGAGGEPVVPCTASKCGGSVSGSGHAIAGDKTGIDGGGCHGSGHLGQRACKLAEELQGHISRLQF